MQKLVTVERKSSQFQRSRSATLAGSSSKTVSLEQEPSGLLVAEPLFILYLLHSQPKNFIQ